LNLIVGYSNKTFSLRVAQFSRRDTLFGICIHWPASPKLRGILASASRAKMKLPPFFCRFVPILSGFVGRPFRRTMAPLPPAIRSKIMQHQV